MPAGLRPRQPAHPEQCRGDSRAAGSPGEVGEGGGWGGEDGGEEAGGVAG